MPLAPGGTRGDRSNIGTMSYMPPIMGQMIAGDVIRAILVIVFLTARRPRRRAVLACERRDEGAAQRARRPHRRAVLACRADARAPPQ